MENITGQPLSEIFSSVLIDPLGLNATSFGVPASADNSIVPFDPIVSFYAADVYEKAPTGGYFSSVNDMTKIGLSILNSTFLTAAQTRNWMKPKSFTSNANYSVGAPWEIVRAPGDRVSYLYTKNGELGLYGSQIVLMPDYDVGFTVLAAGQSAAQSIPVLSDIISEIFYPALEAAAKEEAGAHYAGTYQDPVGVNSSITIITDDRPGLGIQQWIFNGTDGFGFIRAALQAPDLPTFTLRLYPTGLKATDRSGRTTRVAWRAVFDIPSLSSSGPSSQGCVSWFVVDALIYGGIGFDEFVFNLGSDGRAVSIEPRVLQQNALQRQQGSGKMI